MAHPFRAGVPMSIRLSLAFLLLAAVVPAAAARGVDLTTHVMYPVRVDVDASGTVTAAEPMGDVIEALRPSLVAAARLAEFEPATKNGVPVPSRTAVVLTVSLKKHGRGLAAQVTNVSAGSAVPLAPPRYPRDALRAQQSARVVLRLVFDASGQRDESLSGVERVDGPLKEQRPGRPTTVPHEAEFRKAALASIAAWTYAPDEVDGQPVPVDIRIPMTFCAGVNGCPEFPAIDASQPVVTSTDASIRLAALRSAPLPANAAGS